jgi:hypothetical protein
MRMRKKQLKHIVTNVFLILLSLSLYGENTALSYSHVMDWQTGIISIDVMGISEISRRMSPETKFKFETDLEIKMPSIFLDCIKNVYVDSYSTVDESILRQKIDYEKFKSLSGAGSRLYASLSDDYSKIRVHYEYPILGESSLVSCFIFHTRPVPMRSVLGFSASGRFSGLLIYAKGEYNLYAKETKGKINRALFPAIYDEEMNLVLDKSMCDPVYLKKWGMAAYTDSLDEKNMASRIGVAPLRALTAALFGKYNTDLILPTEDIQKLLASGENRKILKECRIVIVTDQ